MKWQRKIRELPENPFNKMGKKVTGPGVLHVVVLEDEYGALDPFRFTTAMFIPNKMDAILKKLSLQEFEENARTQLLKERDLWFERNANRKKAEAFA